MYVSKLKEVDMKGLTLKSNALSNKVINDRPKCCKGVLHDECLSFIQRKNATASLKGHFLQLQGSGRRQSSEY